MYDNSIALMSALQEAGVEYRSDTPWEDDNLIDTIRVGWQGAHLPRTVLLLRITDRGAHLEVPGLGCVAADMRARALEMLNELNEQYRWVKFSMDESQEVGCASDVYMVPEVAGLFGMAAMGRMFDTLDEVWPRLHELFL